MQFLMGLYFDVDRILYVSQQNIVERTCQSCILYTDVIFPFFCLFELDGILFKHKVLFCIKQKEA